MAAPRARRRDADGRYWIDPDGDGGDAKFGGYCDMANGGWTLAWVYGFKQYAWNHDGHVL